MVAIQKVAVVATGWLILDQTVATYYHTHQLERWLDLPFWFSALILIGFGLVGRKYQKSQRNGWPVWLFWIGFGSNLLSYLRFGLVPDYWWIGFGIWTNLSDCLIWISLGIFMAQIIWRSPALPESQTPEAL